METTINLNENVYVELNEKGWMVLENSGEYIEAKLNTGKYYSSNGVKTLTCMQLSTFMRIFGPSMYTGAEAVVEKNNVYFGDLVPFVEKK